MAGTSVINLEWERYQPFNSTNFVFTPNTLNLTATIPSVAPVLRLAFANLGREGSFWFEVAGCRKVASGRCRCLPDSEGARTQKPMIRRFQQVAAHSEEVLDDGVEREKLLRSTSRLESAHYTVPFGGSADARLRRDCWRSAPCCERLRLGSFAGRPSSFLVCR